MKRGFITALAAICWSSSVSAQVSESADVTLTIEKEPPPTQVAISGFTDHNMTYNAVTGEFDTNTEFWPMCLYSYEDEFYMTVSGANPPTATSFVAASSTTSEELSFRMTLFGRSSAGTPLALGPIFRPNRRFVVDIADHKQDEQCSSHLNAQFSLRFINLDDVAASVSTGSTHTFSETITITLEPML